jgi:formylglycine-generating enzyme required for sulfatase activity
MSDFNPYHQWLGISETARPVSKYRLLGIDEFESDRDVISAAAEQRTIYLRTLQAGEHEVLVAQLLNEVSQARVTLLNADQKDEYDEELRKQQTPEPEAEPTQPPIPVVQTPAPVQNLPSPTPIANRNPVPQKIPRSIAAVWPIVQPAKKPRWQVLQENWKRPAVIGVSVVGVIAVFVLFISMISSGDVDPVANISPPIVNDSPPIQTSERKLEPEPKPPSIKPDDPNTDPNTELILSPGSITNSIDMELKIIAAGTFMMGIPEDVAEMLHSHSGSAKPAHEVIIATSLYFGMCEVTQSQWAAVLGAKANRRIDPLLPQTGVSWNDAIDFCQKLSELPAEKAAGRVYRLPTEAEWEYVYRAGTKSQFFWGYELSRIVDFGWVRQNSGTRVHPVATKSPNPWGIHDMNGNLWEWCQDWYGPYPSKDQKTSPDGPQKGKLKVMRGGSFNDSGTSATYRNMNPPDLRHSLHGLRVVMDSKAQW